MSAPQLRINYAQKLKITLLNNVDDDVRIRFMPELALTFYELGCWSDFNIVTDQILRDASHVNDTLTLAKAYKYKAEYFKNIFMNDSSFYYFMKAEKLYSMKGDKLNLGKILLRKGIIQYFEGDYLGAELSLIKSTTLLNETSERQLQYEALSMSGIVANDMKEYTKAIEYHTRAYNFAKEYKIDDELNQEATSLNNIGNVYQNINQEQNAIKFFTKALKDKDIEREFPSLYATLIDNLALAKLRVRDYKDILSLFKESLQIRDSMNSTSGIVYSKIHLSQYFAEVDDTLSSKDFAIEALILAKKSDVPVDVLASLKQIAAVDRHNSTIYSKEYIKISDSLQQSERQSKDKFARIQFETDEISLQKDKLEEQNRNLLLFFVGTVMIGLLLFVIRTQRAKNRELLHKQAQQKANEDIYNLMLSQQNKIEEGRIQEKKRIAQELHDGVLGRLFGARLNLDSLNKMDGEDAEEKRNNYLSELKNIEQDIREISHDLNREKFVLINNFVAILNNLLEEQAASFNAEVVVNIDQKIKWVRVNNSLKINLYRIVQEALQNINKYAKATQITVNLQQKDGNIILNITDNGIGFDADKKSKGIGLQNMLSRASECDGAFDINSKKGKGTSITIEFPIENKPITA